MRLTGLIAAIIGSAVLVACATPTPYQAKVDRYGYANQRVEDDRFRVTFAGNSLTDRETVETYLLYRAAEITQETGGTWFQVTSEDTESLVSFRTTSTGTGFGRFSYYSGFHNRGFGAGFDSATSRPIPRYSAMAMIRVGSGPEPEDDAQVFNAEQVLRNLGPLIVRPPQQTAAF